MRSLLLLLLSALATSADIVTTTGGTTLRGRLTGLEDGHFLVAPASNATVRVPAATVTGVDFHGRSVPARLQTRDGMLEGEVWLFTRAAFHLDKPDGETVRVPAAHIVRAWFGPPEPAPLPATPPPPRPATPAVASTQLITRGDRVDLAAHLAAGKVTIVDFYAEWCGPCRQLAPWLENFVATEPEVVLRKVDIVGWQSPVARQYDIRGVPLLQIYDRRGRKVGEISGFNEAVFRALIQRAKDS